jgi:hypothetical protein
MYSQELATQIQETKAKQLRELRDWMHTRTEQHEPGSAMQPAHDPTLAPEIVDGARGISLMT